MNAAEFKKHFDTSGAGFLWRSPDGKITASELGLGFEKLDPEAPAVTYLSDMSDDEFKKAILGLTEEAVRAYLFNKYSSVFSDDDSKDGKLSNEELNHWSYSSIWTPSMREVMIAQKAFYGTDNLAFPGKAMAERDWALLARVDIIEDRHLNKRFQQRFGVGGKQPGVSIPMPARYIPDGSV